MTYKEIKQRLSQCELTLEKLKDGSYRNMDKTQIQSATNQLEIIKEALTKKLEAVEFEDEKEAAEFAEENPETPVSIKNEMKPGSEEAMEQERFNSLSPKDQETIQKIYAMMQAEKDKMSEGDKYDREDGDGHIGTNTDADFEREQLAQLDARNEGDLDVGHQDDEPNMLKKDIYDIAVYAAKLYKQLDKYDKSDGEVDFPHWWQGKVIKAREFISSAQHYLEAEEKQPALDQLALEENTMNEGRSLSDIKADIDKVKQLAPSMNKLPQDDPKRKAFIAKVKKLNQEKKDHEAMMHNKVAKTGADQELSDIDEAGPSGFGTGLGRSKTISKGREARPDLKAKQAAAVKKPAKYVMKGGVPHKFDADGNLVPLKKKVNERVATLSDFIDLIQSRSFESDQPIEEEALEVIEALADHFGIKIQIGGFVGEDVDEGYYDNYEPKHFDICPGAEALRKRVLDGEFGEQEPVVVGKWTMLHDELFAIEKLAIKKNFAQDAHVREANDRREQILHLSREMNIPAAEVGYLKGHIDKIIDIGKKSGGIKK